MKFIKFKQKVWQAIKLIPRGRVTTYKEIARYLGKPKAYRAVGSACRANPYAPAVPCHRVVKSDGSLGGYSGGVKQKIILLRREGVVTRMGKVKDFKKKVFKF